MSTRHISRASATKDPLALPHRASQRQQHQVPALATEPACISDACATDTELQDIKKRKVIGAASSFTDELSVPGWGKSNGTHDGLARVWHSTTKKGVCPPFIRSPKVTASLGCDIVSVFLSSLFSFSFYTNCFLIAHSLVGWIKC